jgi:hypothetical protein
MTTATLTIEGIRTVRYIPRPGEHQLSINLGLADAATVFEFARELGVKPEVVQIPTRSGVEVHALLVCEHSERSALGGNLSGRLDELATKINPDAIRHVYGRLKSTDGQSPQVVQSAHLFPIEFDG